MRGPAANLHLLEEEDLDSRTIGGGGPGLQLATSVLESGTFVEKRTHS